MIRSGCTSPNGNCRMPVPADGEPSLVIESGVARMHTSCCATIAASIHTVTGMPYRRYEPLSGQSGLPSDKSQCYRPRLKIVSGHSVDAISSSLSRRGLSNAVAISDQLHPVLRAARYLPVVAGLPLRHLH